MSLEAQLELLTPRIILLTQRLEEQAELLGVNNSLVGTALKVMLTSVANAPGTKVTPEAAAVESSESLPIATPSSSETAASGSKPRRRKAAAAPDLVAVETAPALPAPIAVETPPAALVEGVSLEQVKKATVDLTLAKGRGVTAAVFKSLNVPSVYEIPAEQYPHALATITAARVAA